MYDDLNASIFQPSQGIFVKRFNSIALLLIYCYNKMIENKESIASNHEEYIRDVLLEEYIIKHQHEFGLGYIFFNSEKRLIVNRNVTGRTDIQATFVIGGIVDYKEYFIVECKRIKNTSKNLAYIDEGLLRFTSNVYAQDRPIGGMVGFVEKSSITIDDIVIDLNNRLASTTTKIKTLLPLTSLKVDKSFPYSYESKHERDANIPIMMYHLFFDFSTILT